MDYGFIAQQQDNAGHQTRAGYGQARDKVEVSRGMLIKTDPAARQLLIHINTQRAENNLNQFIISELDADHLFVDPRGWESVEQEFQAKLEEFTFKHADEEQKAQAKKDKAKQQLEG